MKYLIIASLLFVSACQTHPHDEGRDNYIQVIEKNSAGDTQFSGVYNHFEFRATILNEEVSRAIHNRMTTFFAWDEAEADKKLDERLNANQTKTRLWVSFFTPERADDNMANKKSIWKVYLIVDGQRYKGHAKKANMNFHQAEALFPYHTRWTTPYYVDFEVPTANIGTNPKLLVTGPLGKREVTF